MPMATPNPDLEYLFIADRPLVTKATESDGAPLIVGIGSSEVRDLEGDEMTDKALHSLCSLDAGYGGDDEAPPVNTAFIDHIIDSDHILGTIESANLTNTRTRSGAPKAAIEFGVRAFTDNPRAARTVKAVEKGVQIGYSVGFAIKDYEIIHTDVGKPSGIRFLDVSRRELSSTPMPANQLCWVTGLAKSLRAKGVIPAVDDVRELEYVCRHWTDLDALAATRLLKLAKRLEARAATLTISDLLGDREYAGLSDDEKTDLARQTMAALALVA